MLLDKLVIGSSVESIAYAFLNDCYFFPTSFSGPLFYEEIPVKFLGSPRKDFTWSRLQLLLALQGKLLNCESAENIRINENLVKFSQNNKLYKYEFEKCEVFDPTGIELENRIRTLRPSTYLVHDDFELSNLGGKHRYLEPKISNDTLAAKIHYYISDRVDGSNYVTDCVAESVLTKKQINDFEYSDSMARFAVERHLASIGVYGNFMKYYKNGSPKYRKPKIIHRRRIVLERDNNQYYDSENVRMLNLKLSEVFDEISSTRS